MDALYPCHIHLYDRAPAPLPGFQEDEPQRQSAAALTLQHLDNAALWSVEYQRLHPSGQLMADGDAAARPELEVVTHSLAKRVPLKVTERLSAACCLLTGLTRGIVTASVLGHHSLRGRASRRRIIYIVTHKYQSKNSTLQRYPRAPRHDTQLRAAPQKIMYIGETHISLISQVNPDRRTGRGRCERKSLTLRV